MEAYSLDLRERLVQSRKEGLESRQQTAERFAVSLSFLQKLLRRWRQSGSLAAKNHGGGRQPALDAPGLEVLRDLVDQQPDATLEELKDRLRKRTGKAVSKSALGRYLQALGLPRKRSPFMPASRIRRGSRSCVGSSRTVQAIAPKSWSLWMKAVPPRA